VVGRSKAEQKIEISSILFSLCLFTLLVSCLICVYKRLTIYSINSIHSSPIHYVHIEYLSISPIHSTSHRYSDILTSTSTPFNIRAARALSLQISAKSTHRAQLDGRIIDSRNISEWNGEKKRSLSSHSMTFVYL